MNNFRKLDSLLRDEAAIAGTHLSDYVYDFASAMADIEKIVAVVSDLSLGSSKIFDGGFGRILGVKGYTEENSIWESRLLNLMSEHERENKFMAELRFFHYLRAAVKNRNRYFMMSKLRFNAVDGRVVNVLHRMYYIYDEAEGRVRFAICMYGPLYVDFKGKNIVVDAMTGDTEELTSVSDSKILSRREIQVLSLIDSGLRSNDIAEKLSISRHTVNRHRQEIIAKLQVRSSIEACRLAKSMGFI